MIVLSCLLCLTLCNPMDCSPPGFSLHGILQARILEWVAIPFSRGSSRPRDQTQFSCIAGKFFYHLSHQGSPFYDSSCAKKKKKLTRNKKKMELTVVHSRSSVSENRHRVWPREASSENSWRAGHSLPSPRRNHPCARSSLLLRILEKAGGPHLRSPPVLCSEQPRIPSLDCGAQDGKGG